MRRIALFLVLLTLALALSPSAIAEPPPYVVIVHPSHANPSYERKFIEVAFLKKVTRWPNGYGIRPVDLAPDSPVRERFSQDVLRRSVEEVRAYWQQILFSRGDVPPPELASEDDVVKHVLKHPGAIGYVSGSANIGAAKIVRLR